ncbi:Piwi1-like protein, partial [Leptotrombidium deliense]
FLFSVGLKKYFDKNRVLPQRVVVYRDGVSEGQIQHVYETELKKIKEAIGSAVAGTGTGGTSDKLQLTFIIVNKRVNTRFFLCGEDPEYRNPTPGTIVDTVVTRKQRYDFYLVSQSVRQGTVSPTLYNIIEDESSWKAHHHQMLTYKLCHLYFNWMVSL